MTFLSFIIDEKVTVGQLLKTKRSQFYERQKLLVQRDFWPDSRKYLEIVNNKRVTIINDTGVAWEDVMNDIMNDNRSKDA